MNKAAGLLQSATAALKNLGLKAPWKYTGPLSSPEYQSHLPKVSEYRRFAPASPPVRAAVPAAEPERVYDIKYFTRDSRRNELRGGSMQMVKGTIDVAAPDEALAAAAGPVTPGEPYRYTTNLRSILDNENNGYTV